LVTQVDAQLGQHLRNAVKEADAELDRLDGYLEQEENCLRKCRPSEIEARLEAELDNLVNDVNADFGPAATTLARRRVALEHFVQDNRLDRTLHWGKPLTRQSIYLILGITAFEFLLNTAFFSGSQRSGMIGGAALAMLLSISTIILGVAFGIAYQFSNPRAEGKGWYGRFGILLLLAATLYYLLLLTLARLAGEAGDVEMFRTAAKEILVHPFSGLLDLPALAYFFFSIAVIAGVYYKFIDTMGHFPRLRSHRLAAEKAEAELEAVRLEMLDAERSYVDEAIKAVDGAPSIIEAAIIPIKELVMNYENVIDQFIDDLKDISDASRLLLEVLHRHTAVDSAQLTVDYEPAQTMMGGRLARFRKRAAELEDWDEIKQSTIDACRKRMTELGNRRLKELEERCIQAQQERYEEWSGAAERQIASRTGENVTWLSQGAAR
jgi:hypothetical protein